MEKTLAAEQRRSAAKRLIWIDVKRDLYGVTRRTDWELTVWWRLEVGCINFDGGSQADCSREAHRPESLMGTAGSAHRVWSFFVVFFWQKFDKLILKVLMCSYQEKGKSKKKKHIPFTSNKHIFSLIFDSSLKNVKFYQKLLICRFCHFVSHCLSHKTVSFPEPNWSLKVLEFHKAQFLVYIHIYIHIFALSPLSCFFKILPIT